MNSIEVSELELPSSPNITAEGASEGEEKMKNVFVYFSWQNLLTERYIRSGEETDGPRIIAS